MYTNEQGAIIFTDRDAAVALAHIIGPKQVEDEFLKHHTSLKPAVQDYTEVVRELVPALQTGEFDLADSSLTSADDCDPQEFRVSLFNGQQVIITVETTSDPWTDEDLQDD